ncbi:MAG: citrate synthase [Candidatus Thermoplasmatota archaeon]|nr:citrate synthase [Candidatus Thermoplasmatota archaeon]MCL5963080.1 citrate synthase [Candidatus Thermoplasmatota archaeon]
MAEISKGLEDVFIKTTTLTNIDGIKGILRYRGYDINDLVEHGTYEEVIYLMIYGSLPTKEQLNTLKEKMKKHYNISSDLLNILAKLPKNADAIGMLEVAFSVLASGEVDYKWKPDADKEKAIELIAKSLSIVANIYRIKEGLPVKNAVIKESYAETFLNVCFDKPVPKEFVNVMDKALILYADHEVPASTTAALVVSSTLTDMASSIVAGLAALKGPLHGGAAEAAFKQFIDIGNVNNVDSWFNKHVLENKERLMGFGHRVYKTTDPRSKIFKRFSETFSKYNKEVDRYYQIASKLENLATNEFSHKGIFANTDFYSGIVYYGLGFAPYMPTPLFALSRVTGWLAHVMEYVEEQERIIRPRAIYVGIDRRDYVPIDKR